MSALALIKHKSCRNYRTYEPKTRLVRWVYGNSYQARGWVFEPLLGSVNLGVYRGDPNQLDVVGERMARAVAAEYERRWLKRGDDPLDAFLAMRAGGLIRADVLPPGASFDPAAGAWRPVKFTPRKTQLALDGPVLGTPEEAARVLVDWVSGREHPDYTARETPAPSHHRRRRA